MPGRSRLRRGPHLKKCSKSALLFLGSRALFGEIGAESSWGAQPHIARFSVLWNKIPKICYKRFTSTEIYGILKP